VTYKIGYKVLPPAIFQTVLSTNSASYSSFKAIYNTRVRFTPISETNSGNLEHYETNPIFCDVAKTNNIEEWQIAAIQPLFLYKA
jgi:hypothetical protein